jgi:inorganic pyrophosphatase
MVVSTQLPLGVTMAKKPTMDAREAEATARVELFLAIGEFIFEFSQLEFTIRHLLACMLDLKDDKSFDTIVSPYDFRTLCDVTSSYIQDAADCDDDLRTHVKKTFDSCKALNDERVRVAHGTWSIGGGARHVSRQTLKASQYFITPAELDEKTRSLQKLKSDIVTILIGDKSEWHKYAPT